MRLAIFVVVTFAFIKLVSLRPLEEDLNNLDDEETFSGNKWEENEDEWEIVNFWDTDSSESLPDLVRDERLIVKKDANKMVINGRIYDYSVLYEALYSLAACEDLLSNFLLEEELSEEAKMNLCRDWINNMDHFMR